MQRWSNPSAGHRGPQCGQCGPIGCPKDEEKVMTSPGLTQRPRLSTRATSAHFACRQDPTNVTRNLCDPLRITTVRSSICDQLEIWRANRQVFFAAASPAAAGAGGSLAPAGPALPGKARMAIRRTSFFTTSLCKCKSATHVTGGPDHPQSMTGNPVQISTYPGWGRAIDPLPPAGEPQLVVAQVNVFGM